MNPKDLLDFITYIGQLKEIERWRGQFYWRDYPQQARYDSVADHTWRLAVILMLIKDKLSQPFNLEKALKMALIHDLPEIIAGDDNPLEGDGTGNNTYAFNEDKALDKVEAQLRVLHYQRGNIFKSHQEFNVKYSSKYLGADPFIDELIQEVLKEMQEKFVEFKK
ncbi:HD domain-containing protein [Candidatus Uhrbacteria bacterium]|nr:HD domain-containing protein [Candidatus Uhrbacteria bacterium]